MNGNEIRQLNAEDVAEYQAVFLGSIAVRSDRLRRGGTSE